nr:hypothetical protein Iba_chr14cCG9190 [Ipomoea batatas]
MQYFLLKASFSSVATDWKSSEVPGCCSIACTYTSGTRSFIISATSLFICCTLLSFSCFADNPILIMIFKFLCSQKSCTKWPTILIKRFINSFDNFPWLACSYLATFASFCFISGGNLLLIA